MNNHSVVPRPNTPAPDPGANGVSVHRDVNTQGGDFIGRDQIIGRDYVHGDKIVYTTTPVKREERNRTTMLRLVNQVWVEGVLQQSLSDILPINLRLHKQMDAVDQKAWSQVIDLPPPHEQPIPPETNLVDIFAQMNQSMLILGEPGAGKTILLLMLARDIIAQTAHDAQQPIPVVLNLSAWGSRCLPLAQWLVDELRAKYNIPQRVAIEWVKREDLLLLLDGLDEVPALHRAACVEAINQFRQEHLIAIAVCCRLSDYQALPTKLKLHGAIVLQNLTPDQIDQHLLRAGPALAGLREALQKESVLCELAQTPLMLSIMALAYHNQTSEALDMQPGDALETRRQHLFDTYVERMFTRTARTKQALYPQQQTLEWLSWLARMLTQHGQSTFLIEELQISCLSSKQQQTVYWIGSRVICGALLMLAVVIGSLCAESITAIQEGYTITVARASITALVLGVIYAFNFGLATLLVTRVSPIPALLLTCSLTFLIAALITRSLVEGIVAGLLFGLAGGFAGIALANTQRIELSETLRWSWRRGLTGLLLGLFISIAGSLILGNQRSTILVLANFLAIGPPVVSICTLLAGIHRTQVVGVRLVPNQGFFQARTNALWLGLALLFLIFLVSLAVGLFQPTILYSSLAYGIGFGLPLAVSTALYVGGGVCLQHIVLRLLLLRKKNIPWNLTHFLDYAGDLIFLRRVGSGYLFLHRTLMDYFCHRASDGNQTSLAP